MKENPIGLSVVKIQLICIPVDPYMHILNIKQQKTHTQKNHPKTPHPHPPPQKTPTKKNL